MDNDMGGGREERMHYVISSVFRESTIPPTDANMHHLGIRLINLDSVRKRHRNVCI